MKKNFILGLTMGIFLSLAFFAGITVHAQSGQVQFLGAASGTTLAANCPTTPTTPSICVVGGGVYIWQSSTTGWFLPGPPTASGVTSFNGRTGAVVPAAGDYSYSQLSSPPTSVTAGTFSVTSATIK